MAIQPNYLARGGDPYAGAAAINEDALGSIGAALFGNPQLAGQRALRTAQAEQIGLENERSRRGLEYGDRFGTDLAGVFTIKNPDGSTRPATFSEAAPRLGDLFKSAYWANNGDPAKTAGWLRAFTAMTGNEDLTRAGYAASGLPLGPDFAATTGRADEVQARNAKSDKDRATAVAGIGAGATVRAAQIGQEGASGRQREELRWKAENPSFDQVRARTAATFTGDPLLDEATRTDRMRDIVAPGVVSAEERGRATVAAAGARGDATVRAAQVRGESGARIAQLQSEGRVSAADAAGYWRHQAAIEAGDSRVAAAEAGAAARVQAAIEAGSARRDAATTAAGAAVQGAQITADGRLAVAGVTGDTARDVAGMRNDGALSVQNSRNEGALAVQGSRNEGAAAVQESKNAGAAPKPNLAIPAAVSKGWETEIDSLVGESDFRVDDAAKLWLKNRAGEIYQQQGQTQRNSTGAMLQAWEDFKAANPNDVSWTLSPWKRFTAPSGPGAAPSLVPAPQQPAAPAPAAGVPPRPANVPAGSAFNPRLRLWRTPDGKMFSENGTPAS